jgi:hypothetical protein
MSYHTLSPTPIATIVTIATIATNLSRENILVKQLIIYILLIISKNYDFLLPASYMLSTIRAGESSSAKSMLYNIFIYSCLCTLIIQFVNDEGFIQNPS